MSSCGNNSASLTLEPREVRLALRHFGGLKQDVWRKIAPRRINEGGEDDVDGDGNGVTASDYLSLISEIEPSLLQTFSDFINGRRRIFGDDATDFGHLRRPRVYGVGAAGDLCGRQLAWPSYGLRRAHLGLSRDHRPLFTAWVLLVNVVCLGAVMAAHGFGPVGAGVDQRSEMVLTEFLTVEQVDVFEPGNAWLGPERAALIKAGAAFAPCMRRDGRLWEDIETQRKVCL